jgi:hypothetical protein
LLQGRSFFEIADLVAFLEGIDRQTTLRGAANIALRLCFYQ